MQFSGEEYTTDKFVRGIRGGAVGWGATLQAGSSRFRFQMVSLFFRSYYDPGIESAPNRNEYQKYFLADKGDWQIYQLHVPIAFKSGSLKHLEPSGLVEVYIGIGLSSILTVCSVVFTVIWTDIWNKLINVVQS